MRQIFPTEFSDIPFLCTNFCDTRNFLKQRKAPKRIFLVLRDTKFLTEEGNTLLCDAQIFWYLKLSDTTKCSPTKNFGTVGHKVFDNTVKLPPPLRENFRYQNSFEIQKGSSKKVIGTVRQSLLNEI